MNTKIKALIIDDEKLARNGIAIRLRSFPEVEIIGKCASGKEAIEQINTLHPDLIFLDIQMPEVDGFEVLSGIDKEYFPVVIFVTAFDNYALKAFECHALGYLLKPVSEEKFNEAVKTAIIEVQNRDIVAYAKSLEKFVKSYIEDKDQIKNKSEYLSRIMIKNKEQILLVPVTEIIWIEAAGDYVYIHTVSHKYLCREKLIALEAKLNPDEFARVHRSSIVNITMIESLRPNDRGDYELCLKNKEKLKLSRNYWARFQELMGY